MKKIIVYFSVWLCCLLTVAGYPDMAFTESEKTSLPMEFEGAVAVRDNPWGTTAGLIEDEQYGRCIFMTPNTSITVAGLEAADSIVFQPSIHYAVIDNTDGAGLLIWILDKDNTILEQQEILIPPEHGTKVEISLPESADKIKVLCNNGIDDDDCGDWIIIPFESIFVNRSVEVISVSFDDVSIAGDNPWGVTAGFVNENNQTLFFLTPNTRANLDVDCSGILELELQIHPAVATVSDGAGLLIWQVDEDGEILKSDTVWVSPNQTDNQRIDLQVVDGTSRVSLLCNNGRNNDDAGDWVVVQLPRLDSSFGKEEYVCSATYAGDEWVINFWNSEMDYLEEDLRQIKQDGFNSIIICIPWREFQVDTELVEYNEYAMDALDFVLTVASELEMKVYTRIGYTWDYYNDENEYIFDRYIGLLCDNRMLEVWKDYAQVMYQRLSGYDSFAGAFLTWEDFWGILSICDADDNNRLMYAISSGYQIYAAERYSIQEYNDEFGMNYDSFNEVMIPKRNAPDMWLMYEFFDDFLNRVLYETQTVFPNISMEVRLDADVVTQVNGENKFFSHDRTYACEKADYTATMYSIPMGFENVGERVSAEEALQHTDYILSNLLYNNGGKPIYVEQFLFYDNTPQFYYNAQIKKDEVDDYLDMVSKVLYKYTRGYGIWTYRNYRNNMIYNAQFALEDKGWEVTGSVDFKEIDGSIACHTRTGDTLMQKIPIIRDHFPADEYILQFEVKQCIDPGRLHVQIGDESNSIEITEDGLIEVNFARSNAFDLSVEIESGEFCLDNFNLYSFVQEGYLYSEYGQELDYIENIRKMNEQLLTLDKNDRKGK